MISYYFFFWIVIIDAISFDFSDNFLNRLSDLYSNDHTKYFVANKVFIYHIWDRKLNTAILSGCLKEFEGKKRKYEFAKGGGKGICSDADGKKPSTCEEAGFVFL